MKNSDEVLDHVLRGLGEAQPSSGLEDRVLAGVRARTTSPITWREAFRRTVIATPLSALAVSGIAALAVTSFVYMRRHESPENTARVSHSPRTAASTTPAVADTSRTPTLVYRTHQPIVSRKTAFSHPHSPTAPSEPESLAMQEWHAPSQPAPELPLTHEERILRGFAYRRNTEELAVLTPAFRAAENAREQAEFQHFFTKPTTGDNE